MLAIKIDVQDFKVRRMIAGYSKTLPEAINKGANRWGRYLTRDMIMAQELNGPYASGHTRGGIWWENIKKRGDIGGLHMPVSGVYLDSTPTHKINPWKHARLNTWAKKVGIKSQVITVHKHPFINRIVRQARQNLKPILQQHLGEALARRGK